LSNQCNGGSKQRLHPVHDLCLVIEEPFFTPETAGVADEIAFGADDAVAGDDDSDIVLAIGGGGGADRLGIAETAGHLEIADGLTKGDGGELVPDALLEGGAVLGNGKFKNTALTLEILDQLFDALDDHGGHGALEAGMAGFRIIEVVDKADLIDIGVRAADAEQAQG